MARRLFGGDIVFVAGAARTPLLSASGLTGTVYTDADGTVLADLTTYPAGVSVAGSVVTVDDHSCLPLFNGPDDGTSILYASVLAGPVTAIFSH